MSGKPKSKCSNVKNPCKYCLGQVTNRNGLQCQGACKKWAHYKCLHYTPGKISDIKAGIIKVMCPCPDCETSQEKEFLTNPPFTCSNRTCPGNATGPPKCDSNECPSNKQKGMQCSKKTCADDAVECPSPPRSPPPRKKCPVRSLSPPPRSSPIPKSYANSDERPTMKPRNQEANEVACSNSDTSYDEPPPCPKIEEEYSKDQEEYTKDQDQDAMVHALQEMCGTVGQLSNQIQELMCKLNKMNAM